ncbi:helix-turn-helix transcriptional regulator [Nonomuraea sp. NPDC004702]
MNALDKLWTVKDVSAFLGVPIATLYQWRHHHTGPRGRKIGRHLRYLPEDVMSWVQDQE